MCKLLSLLEYLNAIVVRLSLSCRCCCCSVLSLCSLVDVELITENETVAVGSCCDNGRFIFKECGNWWYNCEQWGLQNYTQWVRFGKFGFTMPLGESGKFGFTKPLGESGNSAPPCH